MLFLAIIDFTTPLQNLTFPTSTLFTTMNRKRTSRYALGDSAQPIPETLTWGLKMHSAGPQVIAFQQMLNAVGFPCTVTGVYDEATWEVAKKFEASIGTVPDGIIGNSTWMTLRQMAAQKGMTTFDPSKQVTDGSGSTPQYFSQPAAPPPVAPSSSSALGTSALGAPPQIQTPSTEQSAPAWNPTPSTPVVSPPQTEAPKQYFSQPSVPAPTTMEPQMESQEDEQGRVRRWQTRGNGMEGQYRYPNNEENSFDENGYAKGDKPFDTTTPEKQYWGTTPSTPAAAIPQYTATDTQASIPQYTIPQEQTVIRKTTGYPSQSEAIPSYTVPQEQQVIRKMPAPEPIDEMANTVQKLALTETTAQERKDFITELLKIYEKYFGDTPLASMFPKEKLRSLLDYTRTREFNDEIHAMVKQNANHPLFTLNANNACLKHYQGLLGLVRSGVDLTPEQLVLFYTTAAAQSAATYIPFSNKRVEGFCNELSVLVGDQGIPTSSADTTGAMILQQQLQTSEGKSGLSDGRSRGLADGDSCSEEAKKNRRKMRIAASLIGGVTAAAGSVGAQIIYIGKKDDKREKISGWGVIGWSLLGGIVGGMLPGGFAGVSALEDAKCALEASAGK